MSKLLFWAGLISLPFTSCHSNSTDDIPEAVKTAFQNAGLPPTDKKCPALDFSLITSNGEQFSLEKLRGKVVFLNFWASWCEPCRAEMPSMEELYKHLQSKGLEIVACNLEGSVETIKRFTQSKNLTFTVPLDTGGKIAEKYGVQGIPATFIIDRAGDIIFSMVGSANWARSDMMKAFEILLDSNI